jgi:hypothetical protein
LQHALSTQYLLAISEWRIVGTWSSPV